MEIAIDILGTLAFAISGASKAIQYKLDWLGLLVMAIVTGAGGGVLRDIMLGSNPPVALSNPIYVTVCIGGAFLTLGAQRIINASSRIVLIADALGLGFFTAIGASKAEFANAGPLAIVLLATLTAAGGGLLRDMLVSEIPQVLKSDFYATAAIAGGILFVLLDKFGVSSSDVKMAAVTIFTFALRIIAMRKNFQLPKAE